VWWSEWGGKAGEISLRHGVPESADEGVEAGETGRLREGGCGENGAEAGETGPLRVGARWGLRGGRRGEAVDTGPLGVGSADGGARPARPREWKRSLLFGEERARGCPKKGRTSYIRGMEAGSEPTPGLVDTPPRTRIAPSSPEWQCLQLQFNALTCGALAAAGP
jgi:hypothetical protein